MSINSKISFDKARVLVVDDHEENLHSMRRLLQDLPIELDLANSAQKALSLMITHEYALAILDVQMPEIDGFELAELMSSNQETECIPIIFVTAINKDSEHIYRGYKAGAVDYIFKPFISEHLIYKVQIFLKLYEQRRSAKRFESILSFTLDQVSDGAWEWNVGSTSFNFNDNFASTLGYSEKSLHHDLNTWQNLIYSEDRLQSNDLIVPSKFDDCRQSLILRFIHKNGTLVWLLCRAVLVPALDDHPERVIGTFTNITELKTKEALLSKSNEDLEQFAYIASHDLRAPLRGISTLVGWIEDECINDFSDQIKEYFAKLKSRVQRMDNLISGILEYSRIGHKDIEPEQINLNLLVNDMIDLLSPPDNCSIKLVDELPNLLASSTQLKQVFSNLIGNAIKYNDKSSTQIEISVRHLPQAYEFAIKDNGPGIDVAFTDKVFSLFQTLAPRDKIESTGIGLTVVKKIVELHNGKVWFESKLGEGTVFYFTWPKSAGANHA